MKKYIVALMMSCSISAVSAGEIKAIVGDMPISGYDVQGRMQLMHLQQPSQTRGLTEAQLEEKVLKQLVDEQIKIQEALKQGFEVREIDIDEAISRLEKQNEMPAGHMGKMLQQAGIDGEILREQVRADLLWLQVLNKNKSMLMPVKDKEISAKKRALKKQLARPTYLLAEIVVPTKKQADDISAKIRGGSSFSDMAKMYSVAKSATSDGLVGWVEEDIYTPHVMKTVSRLKTNEMSAPIQTSDGWVIVLLLDKRAAAEDGKITIWDLAQIATDKRKTVSYIPEIFKLTDCDDFVDFGEQKAIAGTVRRGLTDPNGLPPELKYALDNQKTGTPIGPIQTSEGDLFFMKCKTQQQSVLPSDEAIKSALEVEKMEELSEKLLRQVKRYAVVEYK